MTNYKKRLAVIIALSSFFSSQDMLSTLIRFAIPTIILGFLLSGKNYFKVNLLYIYQAPNGGGGGGGGGEGGIGWLGGFYSNIHAWLVVVRSEW